MEALSGTRPKTESATVAALLLRGHDPTPIADEPPPLIRTMIRPVALLYNDAPWRGPVGLVPLDLALFRHHAASAFAHEIARASGLPVAAILAVMDTVPGDLAPLLDDYFGWIFLADMVADILGIFDIDNPLLTYPIN